MLPSDAQPVSYAEAMVTKTVGRAERVGAIGIAAAAVLALAACSSQSLDTAVPSVPPSSRPSAPAPRPSSTPTSPEIWTGVTDGTWDWGDASFDQPVGAPSQQYTVAVTGPPTLTAYNGRTVQMTSPLFVAHVQDGGFGGPIPDAVSVFFSPGPGDTTHTMDESYGTQTTIVCEDDEPRVGEAADCIVSFVADVSGVQDSYWDVQGKRAAAWPSQKVTQGAS